MEYKDFKTGYVFADIKEQMCVNSEDSKDWVYKRRRCVLRRWKKVKEAMWDYHIQECGAFSDEEVIIENDFEY